ncbi:MAG: hypothetical protein Q4D94_01975 [Bacillota bacterium]|nr:hypothetical protein [Bacillota bacterium]
MDKKKQRLLTVIWILAAAAIRILYFLFGGGIAADTYEYYASAMIRTKEAEPILTSGIAYAYTENLSKLLTFFGNRIEPVVIYQLVLQILWITMFFIAMGIIFGRVEQLLSGSVLAVSPWILKSVFVISPENYFMFFFSVMFLALGIFLGWTKRKGWYRSSICELFLMILGFGMGVLCIWNYLGWLLVPVTAWVLYQNHRNLRTRIWEQKQKELYYEREQVMPVSSQGSILTLGLLLGMYATLMKYTGLTGISVGEQMIWWTDQFKNVTDRCQDISLVMTMWLLLAGGLGIFVGAFGQNLYRRRLQDRMYEDEGSREATQEIETHDYVITPEGRKVELLDNPLPLPKPHVKKEMDFKINELPEEAHEKDDFDFSISENDDFDV